MNPTQEIDWNSAPPPGGLMLCARPSGAPARFVAHTSGGLTT